MFARAKTHACFTFAPSYLVCPGLLLGCGCEPSSSGVEGLAPSSEVSQESTSPAVTLFAAIWLLTRVRLTVFQVRPQWQRKGDRSSLAGYSCVRVFCAKFSESRLLEDDGVVEPSTEEAPAEPPKVRWGPFAGRPGFQGSLGLPTRGRRRGRWLHACDSGSRSAAVGRLSLAAASRLRSQSLDTPLKGLEEAPVASSGSSESDVPKRNRRPGG